MAVGEEIPEEETGLVTPILEECVQSKNVPKQEQNVFRIRFYNKEKDILEEIRPLTGSKWNLAPTHNTKENPYFTFDHQPVFKVI